MRLNGSIPKLGDSLLQEQTTNETARPESENYNPENHHHEIHHLHADIHDAELIKQFDDHILPKWQERYKLNDTSTKVLKFAVDNLLDDKNKFRIASALGNEVATALEESMKQWHFPKWLSNTLYYSFWGAALASSAARAVLRGLGTGNVKTFIETSIQDLVAAFIGPTGIIMASDKIQNLIYDKTKVIPNKVINFIRPLISVFLAEQSITRILDPIGKSLGKVFSGIISNETYKKWSEELGNKLQSLLE